MRIPAPEFIIFYNGKDEMPERQLLKLSDMYSVKEEKPKEEDILRDFLMEHKAEARAMSIFEYDQERHMQQEREAGIEKGRRIGIAEGEGQLLRRLVQKKLAKGMNIADIAEALEETEERIQEIVAMDSDEKAK